MKRRSIFASLLAVAVLPCSAMAANWVQVGPTPGTYYMYYDSTSVSHQGTTGALLSLTNFVSPESNPNIAGGAKSYSSTTNVVVFDCSTHEIQRIGEFAFYSGQWAGGDLIVKADGYDEERRTIHANTANDAMYNVACAN
jgi:hypothetical protein